MFETGSPEKYVHKLDGLPDERRGKHLALRHLTLRNPVLGRVVDMTAAGIDANGEPELVYRVGIAFLSS